MDFISKEKTIIERVELVTINRCVGSIANKIRIMAIFIVFTKCAGWSIAAMDRFITGISSAAKSEIENIISVNITLN